MKNNFKKLKKEVRGITLVALVVTIIILLILSGVAINLSIGEEGIFKRAVESTEKMSEAQEKEKIELAVINSKIDNVGTLEISGESLKNTLEEQFNNKEEITLIDNNDGSYMLKINNTEREYYINNDGEIIDNSNMLAINTEEELKKFRDKVNRGNTYEGKYVYLTNNITLDINEEWESIGTYPKESETPDNENNTPFKGIFDGKGYEINGMKISLEGKSKVKGLFGLVESGTIKNIGIGENNSINSDRGTSSVAGYLYNNAKGLNCYNKCDLKVGRWSGGVFGQCNISIIENCYNEGDITYNDSIEVEENNTTIGGITGAVYQKSVLKNCYNLGNIKCIESRYIGGISGYINNNTTIINCYNKGEVSGNEGIGGIIGRTEWDKTKIINCYNMGNINGIVKNTYSLIGTCDNICGENRGTIEQSYIKTSEEMKKITEELGEAFKEDTELINNGYPILSWQ